MPDQPVLISILSELESDAERAAVTALARRIGQFMNDATTQETERYGVAPDIKRYAAVWYAALALLIQAAMETDNDSSLLLAGVSPTPQPVSNPPSLLGLAQGDPCAGPDIYDLDLGGES